MIVKLINKDNIWIPTPKLFFKIIEKCNIKLYSETDRKIIEDKLNEECGKEHSVLFFNIKINFNILVDGKITACKTRIIKNRDNTDNCSGCIILNYKNPYEHMEDNFEYEFTKEDL